MFLQYLWHPVYATVQGLVQTQIVCRAEKTRHRVLKKQITFVNRKEQYSDSANSHRKNEHCLIYIYQDKEHTLNLTQGANLYRKTRRFSISYFVKPNMMLKVQWNESFWHCNPCETTLGCWMAWPWIQLWFLELHDSPLELKGELQYLDENCHFRGEKMTILVYDGEK